MESDRTIALCKGKETVLVIDDNDMVADICKQILKSSGYDVVIAKSGKEAIEVFKENQHNIDMVILDMILPDMGGRDIYDRLKIINPDLNVLLVSGYDMDYQTEDIMECGCDGFIQKPFKMKELSQAIRQVLGTK